jgi:adenine-specific DNA-methyltransferase
MSKNQKLELTWIGKDKRPRLEPRILLEDKSISYRVYGPAASAQAEIPFDQTNNSSPQVTHDNLLIHGDNLLALKALEQQYSGKVKCVFIDPPYNTGSAFTHYDDGLEHSMWLSLMRDRLEVIRTLLSEDGSLWITIDDNEAHYLKVLCDEIFGRGNFVANVVWQKRTSPESRLSLGAAHDHILVYARYASEIKFKKLSLSDEQTKNYKNPDNDSRGPWTSTDFTAQGWRPNQMYTLITTGGVEYEPPPGRCWANVESEFKRLLTDGRIWFGKDGKARPRIKSFLNEATGVSAWTWWDNTCVGHNQEAKKEINQLFGAAEAFSTPKPERLIKRILEIATSSGDLVLDSFAGSGTTGAVAHKMGRRWIMIELGEHCQTHIVPRLKKVIDGEDQGGISKAINWQSGGGFRYFRLAPSLLKKDTWGNWVINQDYNAEMLAEAMCKHMGFHYAPSQSHFWMHGYSTETDFIYVTTGSLSHDQLRILSDDVGEQRTLLICCKAFMADLHAFPNLTLKKIPQVILHKCEWDHDDYSFSLNVLPDEVDEESGIPKFSENEEE